MAFDEVTSLEQVAVPRQILLVEDEELPRENLARILKGRGYDVLLANNGLGAVRQAKAEEIGVVLMDIVLGNGMDGIEAAAKIQSVQPQTPFIFVTAHANDAHRERVQNSQIREGGWLEKPISTEKLQALIESELLKRKILAWIEEVQDFGLDPFEQLDSIADTLPASMVYDLRKTLEAADEERDEGDEVGPLKGYDEEEQLMQIASEIDAVYDEIISLIGDRQGDSDLKSAVDPLRSRLESLQELQADAMERHFRSTLQYDPRQARRMISRARKMLDKR
ncbi:MAG TPA: response regulator [Thermoanaerobaculia bacterium]|nr:response regulator [Thermoanaerobaculia bacterium]